jgi:putative FmdB family regulatory protein
MPTYVYACPTCGHRFDAVQAMSDDPLSSCPECGNALRKVFGTVGVTFKGSGFYRTDSRAKHESRGATGASKPAASPTPKPGPTP